MASKILVLVGSLRAASIHQQLAEVAVAHAPAGVELSIYQGIGALPFYNEDLDTDAAEPPAVHELRAAVAGADGVLLLTPEYNGTISGVLKNAIDWASRPFGRGAIAGKPVAVITASPSPNAAKWAHDDTRKAVTVARGVVVEEATLTIGKIADKLAGGRANDNQEIVDAVEKVVRELVNAATTVAA